MTPPLSTQMVADSPLQVGVGSIARTIDTAPAASSRAAQTTGERNWTDRMRFFFGIKMGEVSRSGRQKERTIGKVAKSVKCQWSKFFIRIGSMRGSQDS